MREATAGTTGTRDLSFGLIQSLIPWLRDVTSPGMKQPGREVHHSCQSSVRAKNARSCVSSPTVRFHGVDWDSFTYTANGHRTHARQWYVVDRQL